MNPRVSSESVARLRRCVVWMATFMCQSPIYRSSLWNEGQSRARKWHAYRLLPCESNSFPSPGPILWPWQLNARRIAGSLHKSIFSAWPSAAVGGHIWEHHDFNVFATGDGGCVHHGADHELDMADTHHKQTRCHNFALILFFFFFRKAREIWINLSASHSVSPVL